MRIFIKCKQRDSFVHFTLSAAIASHRGKNAQLDAIGWMKRKENEKKCRSNLNSCLIFSPITPMIASAVLLFAKAIFVVGLHSIAVAVHKSPKWNVTKITMLFHQINIFTKNYGCTHHGISNVTQICEIEY